MSFTFGIPPAPARNLDKMDDEGEKHSRYSASHVTFYRRNPMAEANNTNGGNQADNDHGDAQAKDQQSDETTNVRRAEAAKLVAELKTLAQDDKNRGFEIGDLVEKATAECGLKVSELVEKVGLSRQRLCDCRITAVAFARKSRTKDIPFHFFTQAARAAKKFEMTADAALSIIKKTGLHSTREVSNHFAALGRQKDNADALSKAGLLVAQNGDLLDRCHHADFRDVLPRLGDGTVKLVIADPSYDGKRKSTTSATARGIDGDTEADARADIEDLLKLLPVKMDKGGAVALCRPGAALDPAWLVTAIETHGWICERALTWDKKKVKPGRTDAPYGIGSERILILCRKGDRLAAHDDSSRDDVLDFKPIQPHRADADPHHQHEKPLDLMRHFIGKHTHEGELVIEPFGGSGPASRAAIEMNRHWLYCETAKDNFDMGIVRINAAVTERQKPAA
jgi:site-specific DNA-methyltransferase (adenine-specific)